LSTSAGITLEQAVGKTNEVTGALEVAAKEMKKAARKMDKTTKKAERKKMKIKKGRIVEEHESKDGP
jgi:hypothetical protein